MEISTHLQGYPCIIYRRFPVIHTGIFPFTQTGFSPVITVITQGFSCICLLFSNIQEISCKLLQGTPDTYNTSNFKTPVCINHCKNPVNPCKHLQSYLAGYNHMLILYSLEKKYSVFFRSHVSKNDRSQPKKLSTFYEKSVSSCPST